MKGLLLLVRRSLRQHALSTSVSVGSTALACGLVMAVFSIQTQAREAFTGVPVGFDAVLGARGSPLQLVLNTVFHLETSPGNIPWSLYEAMRKDPRVETAIPYAVGDNYRGFRIVGTTLDLFRDVQVRPGEMLRPAPPGRLFDPTLREAVVGDFVARSARLGLGDRFHAYHGLDFDETQRHDAEYVVVGVLEPTNSPTDRVLFIPVDGVFRLEGHVLRGGGEEFEAKPGEPIPDEHKEVGAVMLKLRSKQAGFLLRQEINNQGAVATLAWPVGLVLAEFFEKMGWMLRVLELVAVLVVVVAAGSILASLTNSIRERRREFAILRALGARRRTVFGAIVAEAAAIAALGSLLGLLVHAGILGAAAVVVRAQTGIVLEWLRPHPILWIAPTGMVLLGALAGILPALQAYRTDVASHLTPTS
ncbi:MAG: FtsX-like permease family protein [Planctomycetaceae bacterium]